MSMHAKITGIFSARVWRDLIRSLFSTDEFSVRSVLLHIYLCDTKITSVKEY